MPNTKRIRKNIKKAFTPYEEDSGAKIGGILGHYHNRFSHVQRQKIDNIVEDLKKSKCFTKENVDILAKLINPTIKVHNDAMNFIGYLYDHHLLTSKNLNILEKCMFPNQALPSLSQLQEAPSTTFITMITLIIKNNLITQDILDLFAKQPAEIPSIKRTIDLFEKESTIYNIKQFTKDDLINIIKNHSNIAKTLEILINSKELSVDRLEQTIKNAKINVSGAISFLKDNHIFTQNNFQSLFQKNAKKLFSRESYTNVWHRLPRHQLENQGGQYIGQNIFNRLIEITQHNKDPIPYLREYIDRILHTIENHTTINDRQSTHKDSVHKSTDESIKKLLDRYKQQIVTQDQVLNLVKKLKENVAQFTSKNIKEEVLEAAKRCIEHTTSDINYTINNRRIGLDKMLAVGYLAINDKEKLISHEEGAKENALKQLIQGLYEIQRGYNISEEGIDDGHNDQRVCIAGSFSKIINSLQGVHQDCNVRFVTESMASNKFPIIVHKEAVDYLSKKLTQVKSINNMNSFIELINNIEKEALIVIADKIQSNVEQHIWNEFKELYSNKKDSKFLALVNVAQYEYIDCEDIVHDLRKKINHQKQLSDVTVAGLNIQPQR